MSAKPTEPLDAVLERIETAVGRSALPVVIFDLDDTLFSTAPRDLRIIHEFAADQADRYPRFAAVAATLGLNDMSWSAVDALVAAGLPAQDSSLTAFQAYWSETFFSDDYAALDLPNPGAVDYVSACHEAGALIFYLTGRAESHRGLTRGMEQGTVRALTTRGFPFWLGRCELTLKQDKNQQDVEFKKDALALARSLRGEIVATFDNEPANANMFLSQCPEAINVWVKTTWNPEDKDPSPELLVIGDFRRGRA